MRSRVLVGSAAVVAVLGGAAACGSDDPAPNDDRTDASASPSSSAGTASPDGSESASSEATSSASAATGKVIDVDGEGVMSFRMPTDLDWSLDSSGGVADADGDIFNIISDETSTDQPLEEEADTVLGVLRDYGQYDRYVRGDNITVAGVEGWVITAHSKRQDYYQFGTVYKGHNLSLEFEYPPHYAKAEQIIAAVLASVEWT